MANEKIALMAHLYRRAGFGATRDELERLAERPYEDVVEDLLHPEWFPEIEDDILRRYHGPLVNFDSLTGNGAKWIYRMINTERPLQEKMALFWHHIFACAYHKGEHTATLLAQNDMFRRNGMSDFRTILLDLSRDPCMIFWLDNNENHNGDPNENYGRELMELFSMGIGNYTEDDIKMAARAFTGWTFRQPMPLYPYGHFQSQFVYREDDHDTSIKTYLGHTGDLNGEDIIDLIVMQPATARFVSRLLYNFFGAEGVQVPAWNTVPPLDPEAINILSEAFIKSDGDMRAILRTLFNSEFFKDARFRRVKSPVELIAGTAKILGTHRFPHPDQFDLTGTAATMGQFLMNPPTVEGWHTGKEWIDGGTLNERVNYAVEEFSDVSKPGIQDMIERLSSTDRALSPSEFVKHCLDLVGPLDVDDDTSEALSQFAESGGPVDFEQDPEGSETRTRRMLQFIAASREYQMA
ncbi:MAG: DUF1800 domain-containing protein [Chloroflexi bacterium]|nr:DUF1800 domain-containing protein [Chloroflexota bacterium]